jgi:hypothetical protein
LWKHLKRMAGGYHELIQYLCCNFQTFHGRRREFGVNSRTTKGQEMVGCSKQ